MIILGGGRVKISIDDYILAAIIIFSDIIVIFLRLLMIIGAARGK